MVGLCLDTASLLLSEFLGDFVIATLEDIQKLFPGREVREIMEYAVRQNLAVYLDDFTIGMSV